MGEVCWDLHDLKVARELFKKNCDTALEGDIPQLLYMTNVYASKLPARLQEKGLDELFKIFFERFPQFRPWLQGELAHFLPMGRGRFNHVTLDFPKRDAGSADDSGNGGAAK